MKTTVSQIRQALANHRRPARTVGARIRDEIEHAMAGQKESRTQGPAQNVISQTENGAANTGRQRNRNHVSDDKYKPIP